MFHLGRYFGTDGVRGVAGGTDALLAFKIGAAAACAPRAESAAWAKPLLAGHPYPRMLENALVAGICSVGADVGAARRYPDAGGRSSPSSTRQMRVLSFPQATTPLLEYNGIQDFCRQRHLKLPDETEQN